MRISVSDVEELEFAGGLEPTLRGLSTACREEGARFFVVGALARDLLFLYHGIEIPRATRDVDVAVRVPDWAAYQELRQRLFEGSGFREGQQKQRLVSPGGTSLDLVPFGGLATPEGKVRWPPDGNPVMTVKGFEAVRKHSVSVLFEEDLEDPLEVATASLAGQSILKLIAWNDDPSRKRDARDLCAIMRHYFDVVGSAAFEEHIDLLGQEDFEKELASARILGRDMGALLKESSSAKELILDILGRETGDIQQSRLADEMSGCRIILYDQRFRCLEEMRRGVREGN